MIKKISKRARADLFLILSLLLAAAILFFVLYGTKSEGTRVAVIVDNVTVAEYPLTVDGEFPLLGGKNVLVIEGGAAYIKESQCPDHLCERQGRILHSGKRIVCLPHHLTVKIV